MTPASLLIEAAEKLLPCPFCGKPGRLLSIVDRESDACVECTDEYCCAVGCDESDEATIARWNTRTSAQESEGGEQKARHNELNALEHCGDPECELCDLDLPPLPEPSSPPTLDAEIEALKAEYKGSRDGYPDYYSDDVWIGPDADDVHDAIDRTVAIMDRRVRELRKAITLAEQRFREYGDLHAAKPDMVKAQRNYEMADMLRIALGKPDGGRE